MNIARTNYGLVEGELLNSGVAVFKGIPYASPPVGNLRWRRPIPPQKWEGVRLAKKFSNIYPQTDSYHFYCKEFGRPSDYPSSEDCLYLNIWTKAQNTTEKNPVIFFIHGGGYDHGYGHRLPINGENFAKMGNIFVSFNYRLGIFGFLSHPLLEQDENEVYVPKENEYEEDQDTDGDDSDEKDNNKYLLNHRKDGHEQSGNYGLYDQLAALIWVRENISNFGGDPNNIILAGQSAGAMSIQILYESKMTQGLFSKVIMMSGGGYITHIPILKSLGCRKKKQVQRTSARILLYTLKCRTLADARKLTTRELYEAYRKTVIPFTLTPYVDGEIYTTSHKTWEDHMRDLCLIEKLQKEDPQKHNNYNFDLSELYYYRSIPMIIGSLKDEFGFETRFYFYRCTINLCNFLSESVFSDENSSDIKGPYLYFGKYSMPGKDKNKTKGAFHSSELWLVFCMCKYCWRKMGEKEENLSHMFAAYWSNFAHTGNPNGEGLPLWKPFTTMNQCQLEISDYSVSMEKKRNF